MRSYGHSIVDLELLLPGLEGEVVGMNLSLEPGCAGGEALEPLLGTEGGQVEVSLRFDEWRSHLENDKYNYQLIRITEWSGMGDKTMARRQLAYQQSRRRRKWI